MTSQTRSTIVPAFSARALLQLFLCLFLVAALLVSSGFAATKKLDRHRYASQSQAWNDSPLVNASLLSEGSSVPGGSSSASLSLGSLEAPTLVGNPAGTDNWLGGIGNWNDGTFWSANSPPHHTDDVTIDSSHLLMSGKNDLVTLDAGNPTINSLTLGGDNNGFTSELDAGQTLKISDFLTVGQNGTLIVSDLTVNGKLTNSGSFVLGGIGQFATVGSLHNSGFIDLSTPDGTLTVTGGANNSGTIKLNPEVNFNPVLKIDGLLTNSGTLYSFISSPANSLSAEFGSVVNSGHITTAGGDEIWTIDNSLTNEVGGGVGMSGLDGLLIVKGDVNNAGLIATEATGFGPGGGGNAVTIDGKLTNSGTFQLLGFVNFMGVVKGDMATINNLGGEDVALDNSGTIDLENASTLTVNGAVTNSGILSLSGNGGSGGNTLNIPGQTALTNNPGGLFAMYGPGDMATIGVLNNSGTVDVRNGSTLEVLNDLGNQAGASLLLSGSGTNVKSDETLHSAGKIDLENGAYLFARDITNSGRLYTSFAHSGGNTLNIVFTLNNNPGGEFRLQGTGLVGGGDTANVGTIDNSGLVYVGTGSTLNLTDQPNGITDVVAGSLWGIYGNLAAAGVANTGFANLTSVEGSVYIGNNQANTITPGGGLLTVSNGGVFEADYPGTTVQINGSVNNFGTIATSGDCCGGVTLTITDTLTNNPGANFNVGQDAGNAGSDTVDLGTLVNNGTVSVSPKATLNLGSVVVGGTLNNGGLISIGPSPLLASLGILHGPSGNYTQLATGTLTEMISATTFGVINVNGSALLGGKLVILLQGGFTPADGSVYKFLIANPGQLSGMFSDVPDSDVWQLIYDYADGYVEARFVPEPSTLLVLIPGLLGMGYGLRRRQLQ